MLVRFKSEEEYLSWLLEHPKSPTIIGAIYIFRIEDIDRTYIKIGDGETALIDLPIIGH
jgi:hypothetical protein